MSPHLHPSGNIGHPRYQCLGSPLVPYHTCGRIHQFHQRSLANLFMGDHSRNPCLGSPPFHQRSLANLSYWGIHPRHPCLGSPPYNQRSLANLSHLGDHPRYPYLGSPPLPWQCMDCTQGLENCSHACLHHFFPFILNLGILPVLVKINNPLSQEVQVTFGVHAGLPMKVSSKIFVSHSETFALERKLWDIG